MQLWHILCEAAFACPLWLHLADVLQPVTEGLSPRRDWCSMLRRIWDDCMVINGRAARTGAANELRPCYDGTKTVPARFNQASGAGLGITAQHAQSKLNLVARP